MAANEEPRTRSMRKEEARSLVLSVLSEAAQELAEKWVAERRAQKDGVHGRSHTLWVTVVSCDELHYDYCYTWVLERVHCRGCSPDIDLKDIKDALKYLCRAGKVRFTHERDSIGERTNAITMPIPVIV